AFREEMRGQGELVLTRLVTDRLAELTVPRGAPQRYVVLDAHEWHLVAEAQAQKDRDVQLALAPGNYRIKRVLADRLEVGALSLPAGERANVDRLRYDPAPLSAGMFKGDPSGLSPAEQAEWSRTQAFGLLASGNATAALAMFDRMVAVAPNDLLAWRGRAR